MPCLVATPQFLEDTKYQNPADVLHSAFQIAHKTDQPAFVWAMSKPKLLASFGQWMSVLHEGQKNWLDVFDFRKHAQGSDPNTVVFVDVGGGIGHQCALLKSIVPDLQGRVILQDLQMVIEHAISTPGVENTAVDFWTEQPVKGMAFPVPPSSLSAYLLVPCAV